MLRRSLLQNPKNRLPTREVRLGPHAFAGRYRAVNPVKS